MHELEPVFGRRAYTLVRHPETQDFVLKGLRMPWLRPRMQAEHLDHRIPEDEKWARTTDPALVAMFQQHLMADQEKDTNTLHCGIYLLHASVPLARSYLSEPMVEAVCVGWGLTQEYESGYRCEYVQIDSLAILEKARWIFDIEQVVADLQRRYQVAVRITWDPHDGATAPPPPDPRDQYYLD